jgi:hypothetical protein
MMAASAQKKSPCAAGEGILSIFFLVLYNTRLHFTGARLSYSWLFPFVPNRPLRDPLYGLTCLRTQDGRRSFELR